MVCPEKFNLSNMVTVKSYSYSKLVLGYGPERGATVTVQWNSQSQAFTLVFGGYKHLTLSILYIYIYIVPGYKSYHSNILNIAYLANLLFKCYRN